MNKFIFLSLIVLALSFSLVQAEEQGCFLYKDSFSYCLEISKKEAQAECDILDRCQTQEVFLENTLCSTQTECETLLCKSTCQIDFVGRCSAGVAKAKDCQPGCCQFSYSQGEFCGLKPSKRNCEIFVSNKQATEYHFNADLQGSSCELWCNKGTPISNKLETVSKVNFSIMQETNLSQQVKSQNYLNFLLLTVVIIGIIILIYFLLKKQILNIILNRDLLSSTKQTNQETNIWKFLSPFSSNPQITQKNQKSRNKRFFKLKKARREQLLASQNLLAEQKDDDFKKLKRISKANYKSKNKLKTILNSNDLFKKLKELSKK